MHILLKKVQEYTRNFKILFEVNLNNVKGIDQMKKERGSVMKKGKNIIEKLMRIDPKEETLANIFKPLDGIEEKVIIRQEVIKGKILQLKDEKSIIDNQIKSYEGESNRCTQYLDILSKFADVF